MDSDRDEDMPEQASTEQIPYEPPRLTVLGSFEELTRGHVGPSDGIGPGSALGP